LWETRTGTKQVQNRKRRKWKGKRKQKWERVGKNSLGPEGRGGGGGARKN